MTPHTLASIDGSTNFANHKASPADQNSSEADALLLIPVILMVLFVGAVACCVAYLKQVEAVTKVRPQKATPTQSPEPRDDLEAVGLLEPSQHYCM